MSTRNTVGRILAACAVCALSLTAAALDVTGVTARQRWPWNNLVDIGYTLSGVESSETFYRIDVRASYPGMAGEAVAARALLSEPIVKGNGPHAIVWDMGCDLPGLVTTNLSVTVSAAPLAPTDPVYMIVDLTGGASASSYPVRYSSTGPDLADDACRTTELWLKRCPAGTFTMGTDSASYVGDARLPAHTVTLTKPFWLGVFECTQEQWFRVKGTWPSHYSNTAYRATRPVEKVKYDQDIRPFTGWYDNGAISANSATFMGRLRARTGLKFDLPTEAQWECACRAGTTGLFYDSRITVSTISSYARVSSGPANDGDADISSGTGKVGSYDPNPWGFYDMYGNVAEFCGDGNNNNPSFMGKSSAVAAFNEYVGNGGLFVDPRTQIPGNTPNQSNGYVDRGGWFSASNPGSNINSVYRHFAYDGGYGKLYGFRVCLTAE